MNSRYAEEEDAVHLLAELDEQVDDVGYVSPLDGPGWLRDVEAESGDESEIADVFTLDRRSARELGVDLDPMGEEPELS